MSISADEMMKILRESRSAAATEPTESKVSAPVITPRAKETHRKPTPRPPARIQKPLRRLAPRSAARHVQADAESKHGPDEIPEVLSISDVHGHCVRSLIPDEKGATSGVPCEACSYKIEELAKVNNEALKKLAAKHAA